MARMIWAVTMLFTIEFVLYMFGGTYYSSSSLFNILLNPQAIQTSSIYMIISTAITTFGVVAIIVGTFFNLNVYALYTGTAAIFLGFITSIASFGSYIYSQVYGWNPTLAPVVLIIITGPLMLLYLLSMIEWIRMNF
jgi:hypothetical protein